MSSVRPQRIGGLLHAVVHEPVGAIETLDQLKTSRLPQIRVDLLFRYPVHERECRDLGAVAKASQRQQGLPRLAGQTAELADHKVHDVLGIAFGVNASQIPAPQCIVMIEFKQVFFGERVQKLDQEKRITAGLLMDQPRQWIGVCRFAAKCIRHELIHAIAGEGLQADFLHPRSCVADDVEFSRQRMGGAYLMVTIGADQQQVSQVRPDQQILEQIQRGRVQPLQVIEEERQRMVRRGRRPR